MLAFSAILLLLATHIRPLFALYVASGSPCSTACNVTGGGTWWPNLVCSTDDWENTAKGQSLKACMECEITSNYINTTYTDGNTDQYWALFHLKYVQEYCLIDLTTPHIAAVNACSSACSPLKTVLDTLWINTHPFQGQYNYCTQDSSAYTQYAGECAKCLQGQEESVIIGNMVDTMNQACSSQPLVANGQLVTPSRDLFDTSVIGGAATTSSSSSGSSTASLTAISTASSTTAGIKTSSTSATTTGTGAASATGENSAAATTTAKAGNGLGTGAVAGIAVAATVIGLGLIGLIIFFVWRRKRSSTIGSTESAYTSTPESTSKDRINSKYGPIVHEASAGSAGQYLPVEKPAGSGSQYPPVEKPAYDLNGQLHEAPNQMERYYVELPASTKR